MSATFRLISGRLIRSVMTPRPRGRSRCVYWRSTWRGSWRGAGRISLSDEVLVMRGLGTCGFLMLNFVLCIGPLARLDRHFLPLLYNRRHLGVMTFGVGLLHGALAVGFYHGFGVINPVVSLVTANKRYRSLSGFPFEMLGGRWRSYSSWRRRVMTSGWGS
jgi:hypothetical protein